MSRTLGAANETASLAAQVRPVLLVEFNFAAGSVLFWSGIGNLVTMTKTFTGTGTFGSVSPITETAENSPPGLSFAISGVPSALISSALSDDYRGRIARMWIGFFDTDGSTLLGTPYQIFAGRMDQMRVEDMGDTATISVSAENRLIDFRRPRTRRHSDGEQQQRYPGDLFEQFGSTIAEKPIYWGIPAPVGGVSPQPVHPGAGPAPGDAHIP